MSDVHEPASGTDSGTLAAGTSGVAVSASSCGISPRRRLGFGASLALILGNTVGVGIFLTPGEVARSVPDVVAYFSLWVVGGLMAAAGAQVFAELGALFPRAGGDYVFLDRAFGRPVAVAWGLLSVLGSFPGSIAALAVGAAFTLEATSFGAGLATPLLTVGTWSLAGRELVALGAVAFVTLLNMRGVHGTGRAQLVLAWTPIALFLLMALWAMVEGLTGAADGLPAVAASQPQVASALIPGSSGLSLASLASASCAIFFTFSGWNVLTYVGGEVKAPGRTIPAAILSAVGLTVILYLLLNAAFLAVLGLSGIGTVSNAGVATARHLLGERGADAFAVVMVMVILAGLNATVMAGSRIAMAVGADGYLWPRLAELHPRRDTPVMALLAQAALSAVLVLTGSFSFLVTVTGAVMILLSCVTVATIFVFRRRMGLVPPVRTPGYPLTPALFLLIGGLVLVTGMLSGGPWALLGLAVLVALVQAQRFATRFRPSNGKGTGNGTSAGSSDANAGRPE